MPCSLLDVLSFEEFRAVIASPPHRAHYGLEVSPSTLALLGNDENTAQSFYSDWTRDGQPRLSALPVRAPEPTFEPPTTAAAQPAYAPQPTYAPQPAYAPPTAAPAPQPDYVSAAPFSADPRFAASFAPPAYAPSTPISPSQPSGSGLRNVLFGFGIALAGTVVTVASFNASGPGGTFVVAWGAIIFGGIQGIRGIVQLLNR